MEDPDMTTLFRALSFAAEKHRDQRRKDDHGSPYINHPIAVARVLCEEAGVTDSPILCAALLHDTVEDTDTCADELELLFGTADTQGRLGSHRRQESTQGRTQAVAGRACRRNQSRGEADQDRGQALQST